MLANNADDYAAARQNIFFTANNQTSDDGNLTGQCVTLIKWFLQDMCTGFPNPFAARGDARYVGINLVAQGLADEVPYADRRRGDIVCLEYGIYGHIYVQLSGGRIFEQNVNWAGVASRVVDGSTVYASRIGSDAESWRATKNPHVYRIKSYNEGGVNMSASDTPVDANVVQLAWNGIMLGDAPADAVSSRVAAKQPTAAMLSELIASPQHNAVISDQQLGHKTRDLLGNDTTPQNLEAKMQAKYGGTGGNCTADERAYLDALHKITK